MSITLDDLPTLLALLDKHPEWREALRAVLLSEELLKMPEELRRLEGVIAKILEAHRLGEEALAAFRMESERRFMELAGALTRLSEMQNRLAEVQARMEERMTRLEERVGRLEEAVARLIEVQARMEERMTRLEERVGHVEERVGRLEEAVARLIEVQARMEERMTRLEERVGHVEERVGRLEEAVARLIEVQARMEERMTRLEEQVGHVEERVGRLEEAVARLIEVQARMEERMTRLEERVGHVEERVGRLEEAVARLIEVQARMEERMTRLEERMIRMEERILRRLNAFGARWGLRSERAWREGMRAVLEEAGFEVERWTDFDERGEVFNFPSDVEVDVVIRDGRVLVVELRTSVSRDALPTMERKVRFYEGRTGRKVDRRILVTPWYDPGVDELARRLGWELYGEPEEIQE